MLTRKQYINGEVSHNEYFGQFVSQEVVFLVKARINLDKIMNSNDDFFNDIPLHLWEGLDYSIRLLCGHEIKEANGNSGVALSDTVCIAKAAAYKIKTEREAM